MTEPARAMNEVHTVSEMRTAAHAETAAAEPEPNLFVRLYNYLTGSSPHPEENLKSMKKGGVYYPSTESEAEKHYGKLHLDDKDHAAWKAKKYAYAADGAADASVAEGFANFKEKYASDSSFSVKEGKLAGKQIEAIHYPNEQIRTASESCDALAGQFKKLMVTLSKDEVSTIQDLMVNKDTRALQNYLQTNQPALYRISLSQDDAAEHLAIAQREYYIRQMIKKNQF